MKEESPPIFAGVASVLVKKVIWPGTSGVEVATLPEGHTLRQSPAGKHKMEEEMAVEEA